MSILVDLSACNHVVEGDDLGMTVLIQSNIFTRVISLIENMFSQEQYDDNDNDILVSALGILGNVIEIEENVRGTPIEKHPVTLAKKEIWKRDPLGLTLKIL